MDRFDGTLARSLDFGDSTPGRRSERRLANVRQGTSVRRLALLGGPGKYAVLYRRRRAAQIQARHALDLIDAMERAGEGR
jgi:hypothetical protein